MAIGSHAEGAAGNPDHGDAGKFAFHRRRGSMTGVSGCSHQFSPLQLTRRSCTPIVPILSRTKALQQGPHS
jgi:hypothetical protein